MANNPWKMGVGSGSILLGIYLVFKYQESAPSIIFGIIAIAFGIGLISSN